MRVMVMVKATKKSEAGVLPAEPAEAADFQRRLEEMGKFNEELIKAGVLRSGDKRMVIDGPFTETKELVAGFWIWQVKSIAEAVKWVKRCPHPMPGEQTEIEIRPIIEAEEFGRAFARAKTRRVRALQQRTGKSR